LERWVALLYFRYLDAYYKPICGLLTDTMINPLSVDPDEDLRFGLTPSSIVGGYTRWL